MSVFILLPHCLAWWSSSPVWISSATVAFSSDYPQFRLPLETPSSIQCVRGNELLPLGLYHSPPHCLASVVVSRWIQSVTVVFPSGYPQFRLHARDPFESNASEAMNLFCTRGGAEDFWGWLGGRPSFYSVLWGDSRERALTLLYYGCMDTLHGYSCFRCSFGLRCWLVFCFYLLQ